MTRKNVLVCLHPTVRLGERSAPHSARRRGVPSLPSGYDQERPTSSSTILTNLDLFNLGAIGFVLALAIIFTLLVVVLVGDS